MDDTAEIEAMVVARLTSSDARQMPEVPIAKPAKKLRKRRRVHRNESRDEESAEQLQAFQAKVKAANADTERRVLENAIIGRGRAAHTTAPRQADRGSSKLQTPQAIVVKAQDLSRRPRKRKVMENISWRKAKKGKAAEDIELVEAADFVESHRREVGRFGAIALQKHDRRKYEAAERSRLGCRPAKNEKMPISVLIAKRRKQKTREAKKKEMDIASGMLIRSKRHKL